MVMGVLVMAQALVLEEGVEGWVGRMGGHCQ